MNDEQDNENHRDVPPALHVGILTSLNSAVKPEFKSQNIAKKIITWLGVCVQKQPQTKTPTAQEAG